MGEQQTLRDRTWLWGMRPNVLQESEHFSRLGMPDSQLTVEQAIARTGITNVILAGGLPLTRASLEAMPSARRVICKTSLHHPLSETQHVLDPAHAQAELFRAKALAAQDPRIDGFLLDDFSTGGLNAGANAEHLKELARVDACYGLSLPLMATIYTMSLDRPELPPALPYFSKYVVPLWHADQIDQVPAALQRLDEMSGGKPMLLCLYLFDFGNERPMDADVMERHLAMAEALMVEQAVAGLVLCGTCLMDLPWDASRRLEAWLEQAGDQAVGQEVVGPNAGQDLS